MRGPGVSRETGVMARMLADALPAVGLSDNLAQRLGCPIAGRRPNSPNWVTPADVDTPFLSTSEGGISEYEDRKTDTSGPLLTLDDQDGRVGVFHELNVAKDE